MAAAGGACTPDPVEERPGGTLSERPRWQAGQEWTVADRPRVVLGSWEDGGETFDRIRTATVLQDGRIAVADVSTVSVRVFDVPGGTMVLEFGRAGPGPGEFRSIDHVAQHGDTLLVGDGWAGRISRFDTAGNLLDSYGVPQELSGTSTVAAFHSNGDALMERVLVRSRNGLIERAGPLPPDSILWFRVARGAAEPTRLAAGVRMEAYAHPWAGGLTKGEVIFGGRATAALVRDTLYVARGGTRFEVDVIADERHEPTWFGLRQDPEEPTGEQRRHYVEWRLDNAPINADPAAWRRVFDEAPMREFMPATAGIVGDAQGNLWVQRFAPPGVPSTWAVFSPDREWLGDVVLPPDLRVMEIGPDYVLATHRDEMKVETVLLLDLVKPR